MPYSSIIWCVPYGDVYSSIPIKPSCGGGRGSSSGCYGYLHTRTCWFEILVPHPVSGSLWPTPLLQGCRESYFLVVFFFNFKSECINM